MALSSKAGRKPASKGQKANIRFAKPTNDTDTSGADSDEDTGGGAPLYSPVLAARSTKSEVSAPTAKSKPVDDESPKSEGALRQPAASRASRLDPSSAAWEPRKNVEVDDKTETVQVASPVEGGVKLTGNDEAYSQPSQRHLPQNKTDSAAVTQMQQPQMASGAANPAFYAAQPGMHAAYNGISQAAGPAHVNGANGVDRIGTFLNNHTDSAHVGQQYAQQAPAYTANEILGVNNGNGYPFQAHGVQSANGTFQTVQLPAGYDAQPHAFSGTGPVQAQNGLVSNIQFQAQPPIYNGAPGFQVQNGVMPHVQPQQIVFDHNTGVQPQYQAGGYQQGQLVPIYQQAGPARGQQIAGIIQQTQSTPTHKGQYQSSSSVSSNAVTPSEYQQNSLFSPPTHQQSELVSDGSSAVGLRTEPRNFAPRSSATSVVSLPPPRFALATPAPQMTASGPVSHQQAQNDPFGGGPLVPLYSVGQQAQTSGPVVVHQPINVAPMCTPVPEHIRAQRSEQLNRITAGPAGRPNLEVAMDNANFPFVEGARQCGPATYGVVKLKNIPFATKRAEIVAFLGRNSKVLNDNQEPVHIIMERVTSKTNDAYVEFISMQAAITAVEKHQKTLANGRLTRLGDRPVEVELSSQAALMKDLFPLATGVRWNGAKPEVLPGHPTEPWNSFKGFVTVEEMTMLVKHVEIPQRSPFSRDCPQRPFECMISTLKKLPWYMSEYITIRQRHAVYSACVDLLELLKKAMHDGKHEACLTPQLYKRLWTAAMLCPGFTVLQKDNIAFVVGLDDQQQREFNQPRFANSWVHQYSVAPKPNIPLDVLEWYIAIVREETHRNVNMQPLNVRNRITAEFGNITDMYWGYFFLELALPRGPAFDKMTLADVANFEFRTLDGILRRAFPMQY
ncbi:RNA recognition, RNP-1 [Pleurostoma richardsiae]|uniref:RNA recognition, RNP-1 n=1 Tax=Pleurostoma richardsiae TaxID=41990 RepID=A0AA38VNR7_9PEZI|nr:RNA recognition, RNP-1 [Pleurostoma richardsiae]